MNGSWSSSYDPSGLLVERQWCNREGVTEVVERYEYDEAKRLRRKMRGNVAEWKYFYDSYGRLSRMNGGYFSGDEPDNLAYEYDPQGRMARVTRSDATGGTRSVTIYTYAP